MDSKETIKSRVNVTCFSISLDGFGAGPSQSLENPLGLRVHELHTWMFPTKRFSKKHITPQNPRTDIFKWSFHKVIIYAFHYVAIGQTINGKAGGLKNRHQMPVFVLTHHQRQPIEMKGDTVFHFVTDGIASAIEKAKVAAAGKDIRIGGGAATIR